MNAFFRGLLTGIFLCILFLGISHWFARSLKLNSDTWTGNIASSLSKNEASRYLSIKDSILGNRISKRPSIQRTRNDTKKFTTQLSTEVAREDSSVRVSGIKEEQNTKFHYNGKNIGKSSNVTLTKEICRNMFGQRHFLSLDEKRLPPMLYTFPGSGNTWGRLLIEHATGIYSGSVYNDRSLLEALPGEFSCDWRVSVVKVHPHTHPFGPLRDGTFHSDDNKCKRGNIQKFRRAVLLIRNPFDAIWSEFQRRVTQSHVEGILKHTFQWSRWQANAAQLSHEFNTMWEEHYAGIEKAYPSKDYIYIRYEDLKNKSTRIDTLQKIVTFLHLSTPRLQLECAFVSAESKKAHRAIDPDLEMTKETAYTVPLVCRMWKLFGKHSLKHGYQVWGNYNCDANDYPPIPRINVGPRGEYDSNWVKPGQKLLDFGGYEKIGKEGSLSGKNELSADIKIRKPVKLSPAVMESFEIVGMSIEEAMSVTGLGKLGEEGPAWT